MLELSDLNAITSADEQLSKQEERIHDGSSTTEEETDVVESASDTGKSFAAFLQFKFPTNIIL